MSFLTTIKKDPSIRKLFGKRELVIIEKQLLGVKLKGSEITRLSRDIRKKLNAIETISQFTQEFELKKGAEIKRIIEEAKQIILESKFFSKIKNIMIFGSFVENKLTLNSDIDIAVEFIDISNKEATTFRSEIAGRVNEKIDIQVYNILPNKLKKEIDKKGKIIYEQTHKR